MRQVIVEHEKAVRPTHLLLRVPVPWVFVLAYLVGAGLQALIPVRIGLPVVSLVVKAAGGVLFVLGAGLAAWSLLLFRRARTTSVPGETSANLVTEGPYRLSRNPMYVALILAYLGEAGLLTQIWPLLPLLLTWAYLNWTVIPVEEASLRAFGSEYERYCVRVRRWV